MQDKQEQLKAVETAQSLKIDHRIFRPGRHWCDQLIFYKVLSPKCWISIRQKFPADSKRSYLIHNLSLEKLKNEFNQRNEMQTFPIGLQTISTIMCKETQKSKHRWKKSTCQTVKKD